MAYAVSGKYSEGKDKCMHIKRERERERDRVRDSTSNEMEAALIGLPRSGKMFAVC